MKFRDGFVTWTTRINSVIPLRRWMLFVRKSVSPISLAGIAVPIGVWTLVGELRLISPLFLPAPSDVIRTGYRIITSGYGGVSFLDHIRATGGRLLLAFVLVVVIAGPLGVAMGYFPRLRAVLEPYIELYRPVPPLAYLPLFIFWFGFGTTSKVMLLFALGLPIIVVPTIQAVGHVSDQRVHGARSLGATPRQVLRYVVLPSVLPDLLSAIRTAYIFMFTALVAAELVGAEAGLGWMTWRASHFFQTAVVLFGVLCLGVAGVLGERLLRLAQRRLTPWLGHA